MASGLAKQGGALLLPLFLPRLPLLPREQGIFGTSERPRLCVHKSNNHMYAQVVDDTANEGKGHTLASYSTLNMKKDGAAPGDDAEALAVPRLVGGKVAELAKSKGVEKVVFDKGGHLYHGKVAAVADGARAAGLDF